MGASRRAPTANSCSSGRASFAGPSTSRTDSSSSVELVPYEAAYADGFEDMRRRVPDTAKIESFMGWRASRSLDDILVDAIEDAREALSARTMRNRLDLTDVPTSFVAAGGATRTGL